MVVTRLELTNEIAYSYERKKEQRASDLRFINCMVSILSLIEVRRYMRSYVHKCSRQDYPVSVVSLIIR